jgi:uncharacterized protein (DUF58 family)
MPIKRIDAELIPKIRKLDVFARQSSLSDVIEGNWTTTFKGHGMEFTGYRAYQFGDDASLIDWKASLRSKSLLVKEYEQEKSVNVFFLFNVSDSMLFGSTKKLKAEFAAELVSSMSFAILRAGDAVGLSMYTDKLVTRLGVNTGKRMHYMIVKDLANAANYGGKLDFPKVINLLFNYLKSKCIIVIVSDFIGLDDRWYKYLRIASQKYEVIGIMVRDPRDRELPKDTGGQYMLEDPFSGEKLFIDVKDYADAYKAYVEAEEANIEKHFRTTKSDFIKLSTDEDFYKPLITFFKKRSLRLRY